jgi:tRNA U34 5-methylaminomethyl-2-thiouridine-forming methyltransferase MnmC
MAMFYLWGKIPPAMAVSLLTTDDGSATLHSATFDETYHSRRGARTESEHVFLRNGLRAWLDNAPAGARPHILEAGFGTGLNALLTYLAAAAWGVPVDYTGYEAYPIDPETAARLDYPAQLGAPEATDVFLEMHRCASGVPFCPTPFFSLVKKHERFDTLEASEAFDVVFYDAFAPNTQPELWNADALGRMFRALRPGGLWVSYCAKGEVRRTLQAVGFQVERLPGPPGKREMLRGRKP